MSSFLLILYILLIITILTSSIGAWVTWQQRTKPSALPLFLLCVTGLVWAICYSFEITVTDLPTKIFWATIKYPAIVILPVALTVFLVRFAGWTNWPRPWLAIVLLIIPLLTAIIVFTNPLHHLFWISNELQSFPTYTILKTAYGPWFLLFTVYSYAMILSGAVMALSSMANSWRMYRHQFLWLIIGVSLPMVANVISILGIQPWPGVDLSPVAFGLGALLLLSSSGITGILNVSPLAHIALMKQMRDGVLVLDRENRIHELNPAAERILGHSNKELVGKDIHTIAHPAAELLLHFSAGKTVQRDIEINITEGTFWYDIRISDILTPQGEIVGRLVVWRDITERKRIENELRFTSTHDTLTGLYNRMYFDMDLERIRLGRLWPTTIMMIDLDYLKQTNDTFGHAAGDELIRQAANVLHSVFRRDDMVARIGGDEFSALLPECDQQSAKSLTQRLYAALENSNLANPGGPRLSFSIGFAIAETRGELSQAMINADAHLYTEKARRKRSDVKLALAARADDLTDC